MVILISHKKRICNSRCYNARGKICRCICQSRNHGVGYDKAVQNTMQIYEEQDGEGELKFHAVQLRMHIDKLM